jgi:SAM-dependent methyltransferase
MGEQPDPGMSDPFAALGRYYDAIMDEVDFDRWFVVTSLLADFLPPDFRHIDLACGTGRLLKRLKQHRWNSIGSDLSHAMLREAAKGPFTAPLVQADLTALPFAQTFNYVTCVFDSINFLLDDTQLQSAMREVAGVLLDGGLFYFDVITERMVTEHFADQEWVEDNGDFSTSWAGSYDRATRIAELEIRVDGGPADVTRERVYSHAEIAFALDTAGLTLLGEFDSETWKRPTFRSTRVDYVAARIKSKDAFHSIDEITRRVRVALKKPAG